MLTRARDRAPREQRHGERGITLGERSPTLVEHALEAACIDGLAVELERIAAAASSDAGRRR